MNDEDVLALCNTSLLDPNKDVYIYFDHVIDATSEILIDGAFDVVDEVIVGSKNKKVIDGEDADVDDCIGVCVLLIFYYLFL